MGEWMYMYSHVFLTLALVGGEWAASLLRLLFLWGKETLYPLDRRLGEPWNQSELCGEERNLAPTGNLTPQPSSP
jgi:hypothetical protein